MDALANLPGDVLVAILVRLPARSIARCRQVCRVWRSAISHPSFDVAHAERPASIVKVTAHQVYDYDTERTSVVLDFFGGPWYYRDDNVDINPPFSRALVLRSASCWVRGSWDGVVCIEDHRFRTMGWPPPPPPPVDQYVLWNPLTAACATVSPPGDGGEIIGAYSHPSTRRFQLVHASGKTVGDHLMAPTSFRILRVGDDAVWREITLKELENSTMAMARNHTRCVRLRGNLHWLVLWGSSESMTTLWLLAFDTTREKFRLMEAPLTHHYQGRADDLITNTRLGVLSGGKLCAFIVEPSTRSMEVWVLDDYEAAPLRRWRLKERISLVRWKWEWHCYSLSRRFCMDTDVHVVEGVGEGEEKIFFRHDDRINRSSGIDAYNLGYKQWHFVNVSQLGRTVMHRESTLQHEVSFGGASRALSRKVDKNGHICYYL